MTSTTQQLCGFEYGPVDPASFARGTGHDSVAAGPAPTLRPDLNGLRASMRNMTLYKVGLSVALAVLAFACGGSAETPAAAPLSAAEAKTLLEKAQTTSAALTSFHASQAFGTPPSAVEADLAPGAISVNVTYADGRKRRYIGVDDRAVVSTDDGATWSDDETDGCKIATLLIAEPLEAMPKQFFAEPKAPVEFVVHEVVDGTPAARMRLTFKGAPIDVWVADDPTLGPYIRRVKKIAVMKDGEYLSDVKYSKLNVPVEIAIPQ